MAAVKERNAPIWLKIWVWFHICAVTVICLPRAPQEILGAKPKRQPFGTEYLLIYNDKLKNLVQLYTWPTGLWQSWDMFSPNPSSWEGYVSAEVFFADGSKKPFIYPRIHDLGLGIKYFKERFRKYLERARPRDYAWNWPFFARRIALESYKDPANPPIKVNLFVHEYTVPPTITAGEYFSGLYHKGISMDTLIPPNPSLPPYKHSMYFSYIVRQEELKELSSL